MRDPRSNTDSCTARRNTSSIGCSYLSLQECQEAGRTSPVVLSARDVRCTLGHGLRVGHRNWTQLAQNQVECLPVVRLYLTDVDNLPCVCISNLQRKQLRKGFDVVFVQTGRHGDVTKFSFKRTIECPSTNPTSGINTHGNVSLAETSKLFANLQPRLSKNGASVKLLCTWALRKCHYDSDRHSSRNHVPVLLVRCWSLFSVFRD